MQQPKMELTIKAKSSGDTPYVVAFSTDSGTLTVRCNCQAGSFGKLCKHKTELLAGDASRLYDPLDIDQLNDAMELLARGEEIKIVAADIAKTAQAIKEQTSLNKKAKKRLEALLNDGVQLS
jgi:hypothetical protein